MNCLAVAANDPAHIGLTKLHPKDRRLSGWNLREHHFIGKLDELPNDEFEELFHGRECNHGLRFVTPVDRGPPAESGDL